MSLSRRILLLIFFFSMAILAVSFWSWWAAPPATIDQEETLERMKLIGSLRADWLHSSGGLSETEAVKAGSSDSCVHLLFLGVDRRQKERGRSDAIHILRLEPARVTLFSIPRDALVFLHGDSRVEKLNHAYAFGGAALSRKVIENLLKIRIDGYLEVDLQSFGHAAEIAKTLTLDGRLIGAEEIFSQIGGLLSWLRNRSLPGGDIRRLARQQLFIAKSLDWTLTLYRERPRVLQNAVRGILKLLPSDFTEPQVLLLCQIYADASPAITISDPAHASSDSTTDKLRARNKVIANMERFILPGTPIMVDIRTGQVIATDTAGHRIPTPATGEAPSATEADTKPMTLARLFMDTFQVGTHVEAAANLADAPPSPAIGEDTGFILSFYRIETDVALNPLLHHWRRKGLSRNYEDKDELLK